MGIQQLLNEPEARVLILYLTTALGAALMHVFSLNKGFEGSVSWLRRMWPSRSDAFYHRMDFALVVVAGSLVGYILFAPTQATGALAAGLGWVSAVSVLANKPTTGD